MSESKFAKLKVLVVDDDAFMITMITGFLRYGGVRAIFSARNIPEAFNIICIEKPDLILTDRIMAPVDGIEFVRQIRGSNRGHDPMVPIIMITGRADKEGITNARDAGVSEFLVKPFTMAALFSRMNTVLDKPRPFITGHEYKGPDRRRRAQENYVGSRRRCDG
jgi:two-component system chemotaxis response regulator CheY